MDNRVTVAVHLYLLSHRLHRPRLKLVFLIHHHRPKIITSATRGAILVSVAMMIFITRHGYETDVALLDRNLRTRNNSVLRIRSHEEYKRLVFEALGTSNSELSNIIHGAAFVFF